MRNDTDRLLDILEAIERIQLHSVKGKRVFENDEMLQVWMLYHIQIIGEATSKTTKEFQKTYPNVPWAKIIAMRHVLVHDYFGIDLGEVWATVEKDIPPLKVQIKKIINDLES